MLLLAFFALAGLAAGGAAQGSIFKVSFGQSGTQTSSPSFNPSMTDGGGMIVFDSYDGTLTAEGNDFANDVYLRDRFLGTTTRLTFAMGGGEPSGSCFDATVSADGRYVAFSSTASNLVTNLDTNTTTEVFVLDRQTGIVKLASKTATGQAGPGESHLPRLSADGSTVVFRSTAALLPADTNSPSDVYAYDVATEQLSLVSVSSSGEIGNSSSGVPEVSHDGNRVAFTSSANNLVANDTNAKSDCFLRDRAAGTTVRINTSSSGSQSNFAASQPSISGDGTKVAFRSGALDLAAGNGYDQVFVKTVATGAITTASLTTTGSPALCGSAIACLSFDGRYCLFSSCGPGIVPNDPSNNDDVFARDLLTNTTLRLSSDSAGFAANGQSGLSRMAAAPDSYAFCFRSSANNMTPFDSNGVEDLYVRDLSSILGGVGSGPFLGQPYNIKNKAPLWANLPYFAGCAFGYQVGFSLGPVYMPLNFDGLLSLSLQLPSVFQNFVGVLDGAGEADLTFNTPDDPGLAGLSIWCCACVFSADFSTPLGATNPIALTLQ